MAFPLFADFTTEATTHQYWYNGTQYGSAAAWLSAISGTFSRSSTAYRVNSSGLLESISSGVLRFDYDPVALTSRGILLEGGSTNLYLQSNNFSDAAWTDLAGGQVETQNVTGPDGVANSGWTLASGAGGFVGNYQIPTATVAAATPYAVSFYAKKGTSTHAFFQINDSGSANIAATYFDINAGTVGTQNQIIGGAPAFLVSGRVVPAGNGWFRISAVITQASGSTTLGPIVLGICDADASRSCANGNNGLVWGAQFEQLSFASSYIPTTSGSASRSADSLSATPISTWYNSTKGVLYAAGDSFSNPSNGVGLIDIDDGSNNNRADLRFSSSGNMALVVSGGTNQFSPLVSDSGQVANSTGVLSRVAVCLQAGNFIYIKDGGASDSSASGLMPVSPNTLNIGSVALGSLPIFGHIQQMGYWPTIATPSALQNLTAGSATVNSISIIVQNVVGTDILQKPINCVVIGNQPEEKKSRFITDFTGVLKNIFRE